MIQDGSEKIYNDAVGIIKKRRLRLTKARRAVLKCLCKTKQPLSPMALTKLIAKSDFGVNSIDQATVYRIIESFKGIDLVHETQAERGFLLCLHISCTNSLNILAICTKCKNACERHAPREAVTALTEFLFKQEGFTAQAHSIELTGLCRNCTPTR